MKKRRELFLYFLVVIALCEICALIFINSPQQSPLLLAPPTVTLPVNCSNSEITRVWNLGFNINSTGINIITNTTRNDSCENYYAWKQVGNLTYIMAGDFNYNATRSPPYYEQNFSSVAFVWGNFSANINATFLNLTSAQIGIGSISDAISNIPIDNASAFANRWNFTILPNNVSSTYFRYTNDTAFNLSDPFYFISQMQNSSLMQPNSNATQITATFNEIDVHKNNQTALFWYQKINLLQCNPNWINQTSACVNGSQTQFSYDANNCWSNYTTVYPCGQQACSSNWTAINTQCNSTERFTTWYNDTNQCFNATAPANLTNYCDYDGNGIIGSTSEISSINFGTYVYINGSQLNQSKNYTSMGRKIVEIFDSSDNSIRVQFSYDFSSAPLNLKIMKIDIQDDNNGFGYTIVNGINANNKNVTVDSIEGTNQVCVQEDGVTNVNDIRNNCDGNGEYLIDCPGTTGEFSCLSPSDGKYTVTGLDGSGVREVNPDLSTSSSSSSTQDLPSPSCIPQYSCSGVWGDCINGIQVQTCVRTSTCGAATQDQTRTCTPEPIAPQCVPNVQCPDWKNINCINGQKKRTCVDANNCQASQEQTQVCQQNKIDWTLILLISIAALIIIAGITIIIIILRKKSNSTFQPKSQPPIIQKPAAGEFGTSHYRPSGTIMSDPGQGRPMPQRSQPGTFPQRPFRPGPSGFGRQPPGRPGPNKPR